MIITSRIPIHKLSAGITGNDQKSNSTLLLISGSKVRILVRPPLKSRTYRQFTFRRVGDFRPRNASGTKAALESALFSAAVHARPSPAGRAGHSASVPRIARQAVEDKVSRLRGEEVQKIK